MIKVIAYNPSIQIDFVADKLLAFKNENGHIFFADNFTELKKPFIKFGLDWSTNWYDRTNTVPHYINIISAAPIPEYNGEQYNLADVCLSRARDLLATGKKINLMWSGGIDSTLALASLMSQVTNDNQLQIWGTYNSIYESGSFFDKFIKNRFKYRIHVRNLVNEPIQIPPDDEIIVTGQQGDQLTASRAGNDSLCMTKACRRDGEMPTKQTMMDEIYYDYTDVLSDEYCEFLQPIINKYPVEIKTMKDLAWMHIFNGYWLIGDVRYAIGSKSEIKNKMISFFDTTDFQKWSMSVKGGEFYEPHPEWKKEFKQIIVDLTGEKNYMLKKKANSIFFTHLSTSPVKFNNWLCCMEDGTNYFINRSKATVYAKPV
jgi:hypothetical protein